MNAETNAGGNTKTNTETNTGTNADLDRADTNSFCGDRLSAMQATAEQLKNHRVLPWKYTTRQSE